MEPQVKGIERVKCTWGRAERVKMRGKGGQGAVCVREIVVVYVCITGETEN